MKQKLNPVNEKDEDGNKLLFFLSPNDLVYLPTPEECNDGNVDIEKIDTSRIYRFVDSSGTTANFVQNYIAPVIYHLKKDEAERFCLGEMIQDEFGKGSPQSKNQRAINGEMIKELCIPITISRIGDIGRK